MYKILLCVALLGGPSGLAQEKPGPQTPPVAPVATDAIPLMQIAARRDELTRTLRETSQRLPELADLAAFEQKSADLDRVIHAQLLEAENAIQTGATLVEIRERLREWRAYSTVDVEQRNQLSSWGTDCERALASLNKERTIWETTLQSVKGLTQFDSVMPPIVSALADIKAAKDVVDQRLRTVLDLQTRLSKQVAVVNDMTERLNAARQDFRSRIFQSDAPPIWRAPPRNGIRSLVGVLRGSIAYYSAEIVEFAEGSRAGLAWATLMVLLVAATVRRLRLGLGKAEPADEVITRAAVVLGRPVSLAALAAAPFVAISSPPARMSIVLLLLTLFLFPITRLLPLYTPVPRLVYFLVGFYVLNGLAGLTEVDPDVRRWFLALLLAGTICVLAWWGRPARLYPPRLSREALHKERVFVRWTLILLVPILLANVFGFLLLSYLLRLTLLLCSCFGLVLYTLVRVTVTLFSAMLRMPRLRYLASVRLHGPGLVRWTERGVKAVAVFCWVYVTLSLLQLREAAGDTLLAVLNAKTGLRAFNVSLGDVLGFFGVLLFGYLIASGCRFVLREEILRRWRLSRGVPETISTSLYYVLLLLVFVTSLSAAGIQLDKLTVLTGALGVGVGFGMQNIVNNFVSGLILQYERPIRVGDILEVGNVSGEIRRIGIRASTMRTSQGAEVIIPNSTFISGQVVNWTLSESVRRVDIPVRVAYGTDPERVIAMLLEIANRHSDVLRHPEPSAAFMGFGESALEFLLMFWADQDTHFRVRSEVSIAINLALRDADIHIPLPQREIRVHSESPSSLQPPRHDVAAS